MVNLPSIKGSKARAAAAAAVAKTKPAAPKLPAPELKPFKPPYDKKSKAKARATKQLNFMDSDAESDGSGYDVAPSTNFADDGMDISSSLVAGPSAGPRVEKEEDDEEEEDEIMQLMGKKAMKDATATVKEVLGKGKGKSKDNKGTTGGGSWQSMGLHPPMLRSLLMRGYKTPTPIQRASIPHAIATPPRDLVGMARTGSGKTLAYMIPLLHRLQGRHSSKFGPRALVLCPGRELAVQILKVGKELARGYRGKGVRHAGEEDEEDGKEEMRWGLVVGGESLDEQFSMIASNPDVIIATPGRLLHLIVEMNLDLRSVEYVVFDEADRLFEMGFEMQLHEILHRLPTTRQTLLYSATLPKSLVEFAKAGLVNPKLIRLDAETKISSDLRMGFLTVKPNEKEAALLCLLKDVIGVPFTTEAEMEKMEREDVDMESGSESDGEGAHKGKKPYKKRERMPKHTAPHQTLIFTATKHHVEYLTTLLRTAGYSTSHIYGSLDQVARKQQMDRFRRGRASILVVTDVAARGIDIPVLENVVNYDFPTGSRIFVHRVGRTARAGRQGWAWSFVTNTELPYLLDLQLFLGRPLISAKESTGEMDEYTSSLMLGSLPRDPLDAEVEYINTTLVESAQNLPILKEVTRKGQAMYERSQGKASQESYRRAKEMMKDQNWGLAGSSVEATSIHPRFRGKASSGVVRSSGGGNTDANMAQAKAALLARINSFTPTETVFEVGTRGKTPGAQLMQERRKTIANVNKKAVANRVANGEREKGAEEEVVEDGDVDMQGDLPMADENDLEAVFEMPKPRKKEEPKSYRDAEFYLGYTQAGAAAEKGYSLQDGASFIEQARTATFDLNGDDGIVAREQKASQLKWDRKKRKFVQGDGTGSDNKKLIRSESGARLPASFKSGRFEEWKEKKKINLPKVGESEGDIPRQVGYGDDKRYRHNKVTEAKPLDPKSTTYEKKMYVAKKKAAKGQEGAPESAGKGGKGKRGAVGQAKNELRSSEDIRRQRKMLEQRKAKNARPSKKGGKGKGKGKGRR